MNLNSLSQRLGIPTVTLTGHMAALSTAERQEGDERASKDELHISCLDKNKIGSSSSRPTAPLAAGRRSCQ